MAETLVDGFAARGHAELVHEFGVLLPLTIIAECLGVADDELPQFKKWSDDFVAVIGNHQMSRDQLRSLLLSQGEFFAYFADKIAERRAERTDDLISDLVEGTIGDEPLTDDEILAMLNQFLVAGNETTTKLIASAMRMLLQEPPADGCAARRPGGDPRLRRGGPAPRTAGAGACTARRRRTPPSAMRRSRPATT